MDLREIIAMIRISGIMAQTPQAPMGRPHGRGVVCDRFNFAFAGATSRG
ncbi:MAG: hypothetical protein WBG11_05360 [Methylocella sp.]